AAAGHGAAVQVDGGGHGNAAERKVSRRHRVTENKRRGAAAALVGGVGHVARAYGVGSPSEGGKSEPRSACHGDGLGKGRGKGEHLPGGVRAVGGRRYRRGHGDNGGRGLVHRPQQTPVDHEVVKRAGRRLLHK